VVMPQIKDSKTLAAAGAETIVGLRPSSLSAPAAASLNFGPSRRRTFTAQDKLRILAEVDARRASRSGRRDRAPRGALLVGAVGLAASARRGRLRRAKPAKRGPKTAEPNPLAAELALSRPGEPPAEAAVGARRNDHRTPKKVAALLGPQRRATAGLDGRRGGSGAGQAA